MAPGRIAEHGIAEITFLTKRRIAENFVITHIRPLSFSFRIFVIAPEMKKIFNLKNFLSLADCIFRKMILLEQVFNEI